MSILIFGRMSKIITLWSSPIVNKPVNLCVLIEDNPSLPSPLVQSQPEVGINFKKV